MNRIILIGNGFDLAHGMPTSYRDFIDDYYAKIINAIHNHSWYPSLSEELEISNLPIETKFGSKTCSSFFSKIDSDSRITFKFKNIFFGTISRKYGHENWVDIEQEYYSELKNIIKGKSEYDSVVKLNDDFNQIKVLLGKYIDKCRKELIKRIRESNYVDLREVVEYNIYSLLNYSDLSEEGKKDQEIAIWNHFESKLEEYRKGKSNSSFIEDELAILKNIDVEDPKQEIRRRLKKIPESVCLDMLPDNMLFLNFNYTSVEGFYKKLINNYISNKSLGKSSNHIHGSIVSKTNSPIIFGYGDELDDDYKEIEKLNDNRFLENIKSIRYQDTRNYKDLLSFLNSDRYQIFVMGHSCGISDRTLLNTMFEHDNCQSIKVYYHQKSETEDNYSDVIRNISRNFDDKKKMRDRVVNKEFCEPLVPIQCQVKKFTLDD